MIGDPETLSDPEKRERLENYLNAGYGRCYLKQPQIATLVENAFLYFDGRRYRLYAWVIMPNHVHTLFQPFEGYTLGRIIHSWKSYTASRANDILGRKGEFWYREYYDRYIRNEAHFARAVDYIHNNPVAARLVVKAEDWPYSSARK
jgi:REP element-mobilizing transposase RayT